ncbi:MAG: fluoride efflux transporter FluC, partial [Candidatus Puniceispirillaceae bacterium]
ISLWVTGSCGKAGWMAILSVNVAGSLIMGMMAALLTVSSLFSDPVCGFVMIGFLGALTTFSSFALDAYNFFQRGEMLAGGLYLLSSVCLSVAGFYVGLMVVRLIAGQG